MAVRNNRKIVAAVLGALTAFSSRSLAVDKSDVKPGVKPVGSSANNLDKKMYKSGVKPGGNPVNGPVNNSDLAKLGKSVSIYQRKNNTHNVQEEDYTVPTLFAAITGTLLMCGSIGYYLGSQTLSKVIADTSEKEKPELGAVVLINNRYHNEYGKYNVVVQEGGSGLNQNFVPSYAPPRDEPRDERRMYMNLDRLSNVGLAFNSLLHFVAINTDNNVEAPKAGSIFPTHAGKFRNDASIKFYAMMAAMAKDKHTGHLSKRDPNGIFELFAKMCSLNGPTDGRAHLDIKYGNGGYKGNSFKVVYRMDGKDQDVVISFVQEALAGATPSADEVLYVLYFQIGEDGNKRYKIEFRNDYFTVEEQQYYGDIELWGEPTKTGDEETPDPGKVPVIKLNYV